MNKKLIGVIFTLAAAILLTSVILMVSVVNLEINKNNKESTVNSSYDKDSYANNSYDSNTYNNNTLLTKEAVQGQWFVSAETGIVSLRFEGDIVIFVFQDTKEKMYTIRVGTYSILNGDNIDMFFTQQGSGYSFSAAQSNLYEISEKITAPAYFSKGGDILYVSFFNNGKYLSFIQRTN